MSSLSVSVVIPAYNCQSTIQACIECVQKQTYLVQQIIVVDDGSTDETLSVVKRMQGVSVLSQSNAGPAVARNVGAAHAKSDIIFFTDSDCCASENWIERAMPHFEDVSVSVVSGSYGISNPESLLARCVHQEIRFRHLELMPRYPRSFGSYNFGVRREVFQRAGGFDEQYREASGEDNDLSYKILAQGGKIAFEPEALVGHRHPTRLNTYLREQFRHGFWRVKMYLDHPKMVSGDDYTFWKDMVEVLGSLMAAIFVILAFFLGVPALWGFIVSVMGLFFLQIWFSMRMHKGVFECLYGAWVMFVRSFARSAGLACGALYLIVNKTIK